MYNKVLEEKRVAGDIVDRLREYTNAPLSSCIDAARAVIDSMADYVNEEAFLRIASAIHSFEVDINNNRDKKVLDLLVKHLLEIFREKEELSYSTTQEDELLISYLTRIADIVRKTDPRITYTAVSFDDFTWLNSLINLFQMISPPSKPLTTANALSIVILSRVFSSSGSPPLSHFDAINTCFVEKLLGHFESSDEQTKLQILYCMATINEACGVSMENPVIEALKCLRITTFGEILISNLNKKCTTTMLKLLLCISMTELLFDDIFYTNDVIVLKHVLGRELINNEDESIRRLCLDVIVELKSKGVHCDDIEEAIHLSGVNLKN